MVTLMSHAFLQLVEVVTPERICYRTLLIDFFSLCSLISEINTQPPMYYRIISEEVAYNQEKLRLTHQKESDDRNLKKKN